jgi:phosphomannomutase/phosphoglucomutase
LCNHFAHLQGTNIDTIIDCGNGTAGTIFPKLIQKMHFKNVKLLFEKVDGTFPNHEADPTVIENMQQLAQALKSNPEMTLGIGLDGDCDRMNPMTKNGFLVPGDQLLAVYAKPIIKKHPQAAVVFDIKASSSLIDLLKAWGAKDCISPSGHALIKQTMASHNAILAGELSCHLFFKDRYFGYDDGIYGALRLIEIIQQTGKTLDELITIFPKQERSREIRMQCTDETKHDIVEHVKKMFMARKDAQTITIDGIRAQLEYGWGLIRVSNTQPVICLRFESHTKEGLQKIKHDFYKALQPYFKNSFLREQIEL